MLKIAKYAIYDILRNKIVLSYTGFLFTISLSMIFLDSDPSRSIISIMSVMLIVVPLISIIFSTIFMYNSYEFIELLVSQPIKRKHILLANYMGVIISLIMAFIIGVGLPILIYIPGSSGTILVTIGIFLTLIFTSLAFLGAVVTRDKAKGIGMALLLWFFFSVIYDGLIVGLLFIFSDYPLEKIILLLTALNPIDLGRISIMMKMDISALLGYTGAVFRDFFGTGAGMIYTFLLMLLWAILPMAFAMSIFKKKNL